MAIHEHSESDAHEVRPLLHRRRGFAAFTAALVGMAALAIGAIAITSAQAATFACSVDYQVVNEWPSGFQGEVQLSNNGDAMESWSLTFDLPEGQSVANGWNGSFSQSGSTVTVESMSWNGRLAPGSSVTPSFVGSASDSASAAVPEAFMLNGQMCDTGETPPTTVEPTTTVPSPPTTSPSTTETTGPSTTSGPTTIPSTTAPSTTMPPTTAPSTTEPGNSNNGFYVDPASNPAVWVAGNSSDPRADAIRDGISSKSIARWFTGQHADVEQAVSAYVGDAYQSGSVPVLVAYNVPDRDCGQYSEGGAENFDTYQQWVEGLADGLGDGPAYVVLEPDALALNECATTERTEAIAQAVTTIKGECPNCGVYLDAGHSTWIKPTEMANRLRGAGVLQADGFASNVSNYQTTSAEAAFGQSVLNALGNPAGLAQVIDVSRNGNGPAADNAWCDPAGRAVGVDPTTSTGSSTVDALLWIKIPGEADGCIAGAGQFVPNRAFELSTN